MPARLYRYFSRVFDELGDPWNAEPIVTPTLISAPTLAKCGYFGSFPHSVSFACHLSEDADMLEGAVEDVLARGIRTADLGPAEGGRTVSTGAMGDAIVEALERFQAK